MTNKKKKPPVHCYVFDVDLFVAMPGKREAAAALYEALTYLTSDPPQSVAEDPQRCGNWPTEWFFVGAWPESSRTDLVRDLSILLGEGSATISKRLILLGANNPASMSQKEIDRFYYDRIKERGFTALTFVCRRMEPEFVNRKLFHNVISLT